MQDQKKHMENYFPQNLQNMGHIGSITDKHQDCGNWGEKKREQNLKYFLKNFDKEAKTNLHFRAKGTDLLFISPDRDVFSEMIADLHFAQELVEVTLTFENQAAVYSALICHHCNIYWQLVSNRINHKQS